MGRVNSQEILDQLEAKKKEALELSGEIGELIKQDDAYTWALLNHPMTEGSYAYSGTVLDVDGNEMGNFATVALRSSKIAAKLSVKRARLNRLFVEVGRLAISWCEIQESKEEEVSYDMQARRLL